MRVGHALALFGGITASLVIAVSPVLAGTVVYPVVFGTTTYGSISVTSPDAFQGFGPSFPSAPACPTQALTEPVTISGATSGETLGGQIVAYFVPNSTSPFETIPITGNGTYNVSIPPSNQWQSLDSSGNAEIHVDVQGGAFDAIQGFLITSFGGQNGFDIAGQCAPPPQACTVPGSITSNFNGTAIGDNATVWFSSVFKISGLGTQPVTLNFTNSSVSYVENGITHTLNTPDAHITLSHTATSASTTFTGGAWVTSLPFQFSGNAFLDSFELPLPNGLPGGINPVTWSATFSSNTPGVSVNWQWAAAAYSSFSTDYGTLGVKPVDDNQLSQYKNSDHAGTPENFKSFVVGGARGGGGSNFTGSLSGTGSVKCS